MSHGESKVEKLNNMIDTKYSSGDHNNMKSKPQYREENNNEIDELSKDLSEMGCIVDAVKRPPNICVETCVYESDGENADSKSNGENEEDAYSDSFEDDNSEVDEGKEMKTFKDNDDDMSRRASTVKLSKSQSFASSKDRFMSVSGQSSFGSVSVPRTRRINMSFSNDRLREIERHNHILLRKILSARHSKSSMPPAREDRRRPPPAAVQRKRQQRQIDHDNMILLRKIQGAKSSSCSIRR